MDITKQNTTPLPANTLRRAVLMVGLDIADQNTTPLLASVIEQRERIALMRKSHSLVK